MICKRLRFSSCALSALLSGVGLMSSGIVLLALLHEDDYFFPGLMCLAGFISFIFGFIWMCNPGAAELEHERRRSAVASISREGSIRSLQRSHKMSFGHKGSTSGLEEGGSTYNLDSIVLPSSGSRRSSAVSRMSVAVSIKEVSDNSAERRPSKDNRIINMEANNVAEKQRAPGFNSTDANQSSNERHVQLHTINQQTAAGNDEPEVEVLIPYRRPM